MGCIMLRLNKLTDYAIVILTQMAAQPRLRHNAGALAGVTGLPETTVAKILKDLTKSSLIQSARGAQGGYSLTVPGEAITVRQIIEAIEGPIAIADCVDGQAATCCASDRCPIKGNWDRVNTAIIAALDGVKLTDMMRPAAEKLYQIVSPAEAGIQKTG